MGFKQFDIVVVPFPFTDVNKAKPRPALAISKEQFNKTQEHTILAMITTATNTEWSSDIPIIDLKSAGLSIASVIRMKIFTLDSRLIVKKIGTLSNEDKNNLYNALTEVIF